MPISQSRIKALIDAAQALEDHVSYLNSAILSAGAEAHSQGQSSPTPEAWDYILLLAQAAYPNAQVHAATIAAESTRYQLSHRQNTAARLRMMRKRDRDQFRAAYAEGQAEGAGQDVADPIAEG